MICRDYNWNCYPEAINIVPKSVKIVSITGDRCKLQVKVEERNKKTTRVEKRTDAPKGEHNDE